MKNDEAFLLAGVAFTFWNHNNPQPWTMDFPIIYWLKVNSWRQTRRQPKETQKLSHTHTHNNANNDKEYFEKNGYFSIKCN